MRRLGSILAALLKKEGLSSLLIMAEAHRIWRECAGPFISDLASIESFRDGTLTLRLKSPSVELYIKQHYHEFLNAFRAGNLPVEDLRWHIG